MLNEERVKMMVKLASYDENEGKKELKISSYFKKDYVSLHRWTTVIWTTIGYALLVALFGLGNMEWILEDLTIMRLVVMAAVILAIYLTLLTIYWIGAGIYYRKKHDRARQHVKKYGEDLLLLNQLYEKENM